MAEAALGAGVQAFGEGPMMAGSAYAGAKLGQLAAGGGGSGGGTGSETPSFVNQMNQILQQALGGATAMNNAATGNAVAQQQQSLKGANKALTDYLAKATQVSKDQAGQGLAQYRALQAPFANSGYAANDALMDSLGLARPKIGGQAISNALFASQQAQPQLAQLQQLGLAQPTQSIADVKKGIRPADVNNYIQQFLASNHYAISPQAAQAQILADRYRAVKNANNKLQGQQYNLFNQIQQSGYTPQQNNIAMAYNKGLFK